MKEKGNITSLSVAGYFLKCAANSNKPITNLKLQKLVYYAGIWYYTFFNKRLFTDRIEAWMHGPAIPRLYGHFKQFGSNPISRDQFRNINISFDSKLERFLDNIWDVYGRYDAAYLEALTHSELPWQEARKDLDSGMPSKRMIDFKKAKHYYATKLTKSKR